MAKDASGRDDSLALREIAFGGEDEIGWHDAVANDCSLGIDILEESVERIDSLRETLREDGPVGSRYDTRDGVEREDLLFESAIFVDAETDAAPFHPFIDGVALKKKSGIDGIVCHIETALRVSAFIYEAKIGK